VFGEVGLAGELRAVPRPGPRLAEAAKMGFERVILPKGNLAALSDQEREGLDLVFADTLAAALEAAF